MNMYSIIYSVESIPGRIPRIHTMIVNFETEEEATAYAHLMIDGEILNINKIGSVINGQWRSKK